MTRSAADTMKVTVLGCSGSVPGPDSPASGYLIEFGFTVYDYMMSSDMAKKAYLPLPGSGESVQGGHAVCLVGYQDQFKTPDGKTTKAYLVRNSWGTSWALSRIIKNCRARKLFS